MNFQPRHIQVQHPLPLRWICSCLDGVEEGEPWGFRKPRPGPETRGLSPLYVQWRSYSNASAFQGYMHQISIRITEASFQGRGGLLSGEKQPCSPAHSGLENSALAGPSGTMTWLEAVTFRPCSGLSVSTNFAKAALRPSWVKEPWMV